MTRFVTSQDGATARTASTNRRPIQSVVREKQSGIRQSSVAVSETMQVRKARAIGVKGEHRAISQTASTGRRPKQGVAK